MIDQVDGLNWKGLNNYTMVTKEKVKKEIDGLSDVELEKIYLYLSTLKKEKKTKAQIPSLKLKGKLDNIKLRSAAYEKDPC